ncbi:MAG: TRAP transporter large permease [Clostridia bacterium]|nr:TRAP transporter large permease [Clostridia bacterium]
MTSAAWVLFGSLGLLLVMGFPVAVALGVSALITIVLYDLAPLSVAPAIAYAAVGKFTLLAVPFFILAGSLMERSGMASRLVSLAELMVGRLRGGLAYVTIVVSLFFAGISGSGTADTAAIGSLLLPSMRREGYRTAFAAALVACGGSIGIIIPPSITLILYGSLVGASIGQLFVGGIIPGLLVALALASVSWLTLARGGHIPQIPDRSRLVRDARQAVWGLLVPVIILGGIYGGVFTPTEAAAVTVVYVLLIGVLVFRDLRLRMVPGITAEAAVVSSMAMVIVASATLFSWTITRLGLSQAVAESLGTLSSHPVALLLTVNAILIVAGMFLDAVSMTFVFVPLFLPLLQAAGVDLVQFGEIFTVNMAIGQVHPPLGVNLYIAGGLVREPLGPLTVAVIPFILAEMLVLVALILFPDLSLFLPNLLFPNPHR